MSLIIIREKRELCSWSSKNKNKVCFGPVISYSIRIFIHDGAGIRAEGCSCLYLLHVFYKFLYFLTASIRWLSTLSLHPCWTILIRKNAEVATFPFTLFCVRTKLGWCVKNKTQERPNQVHENKMTSALRSAAKFLLQAVTSFILTTLDWTGMYLQKCLEMTVRNWHDTNITELDWNLYKVH